MKIKPIGKILKTDEDGYILSESSTDKIKSPWKGALKDIKEEIYFDDRLKDYIHSIYVRGTVSRGEAIEGISDIDTFAVTTKPIEDIDSSWVTEKRKGLEVRHGFCTGIEVSFIYKEDLFNLDEYYGDRFFIKTQSDCIYGENLANDIQSFKTDKKTARRFHNNLDKVFENAKKYISDSESKKDTKESCRWVMKRILRAGFVLVMDREQSFTRDLYPCYEIFSKYYPEKEKEMKRALEWAINPIANDEKLIDYIDSFGVWIINERKNVFN